MYQPNMRNYIIFYVTVFLILQLEIILGCSVPFSPVPPLISEKVFHSDVVLSGKVVGKQLDLQRSMFGSPVYKAQLKVYCIYKGTATPQNLTVSTVGDPGSNCPSIHLRVRNEYILLLARTTDGRFVPTYFPQAFTHDTMTEVLKVCGVRSLHPALTSNERYLMSCGHVSHGECTPHEPHYRATTPQPPQIIVPTTTSPQPEIETTTAPEPELTKKPLRTTITTTTTTTTMTPPITTTTEKVYTTTTATTTKMSTTTTDAATTKMTKKPTKGKGRKKSKQNPKYDPSDPRSEPNDAMDMTVEVSNEPTQTKPDEKKSAEGDKNKREPVLDAVVDNKSAGSTIQISLACLVMTITTALLNH